MTIVCDEGSFVVGLHFMISVEVRRAALILAVFSSTAEFYESNSLDFSSSSLRSLVLALLSVSDTFQAHRLFSCSSRIPRKTSMLSASSLNAFSSHHENPLQMSFSFPSNALFCMFSELTFDYKRKSVNVVHFHLKHSH